MTEMKLTRNSGYIWTKTLFKKLDDNNKKMKNIYKKYCKKRLSLGYSNTNDYVMKKNEINNEEAHEIQMINAKHVRVMYLYIIRNYYTIFSFQKPNQRFINVTLERGNFLRDQCKDRIDRQMECEKDKKYLQLTMNTCNKFTKKYKDPMHHGYYIIYTLKQRLCNDLVRNICNFI